MSTIEKSIEVNVPEYTAYAQWTKFWEFPQFMEGVKEVTRLDAKRFHWKAEIAGQNTEWDTLIRRLLCDLRLPLFRLARDLGFPMKPFGIQSRDFFHPFHELGKFCKFHPLSIGRILRHVDLNGFLNSRHVFFLSRISSESGYIDLH